MNNVVRVNIIYTHSYLHNHAQLYNDKDLEEDKFIKPNDHIKPWKKGVIKQAYRQITED